MKMELNPPAPVIRRVLAALGCALAFLLMASVFSPDRTRAGSWRDSMPGIPPKSVDYPSADPHEGLQSLGSIENHGYTIYIFATQGGPRYSIYENASRKEMGALLSAEQVHRAFPNLQLPTMDFQADSPLMMSGPDDLDWLE